MGGWGQAMPLLTSVNVNCLIQCYTMGKTEGTQETYDRLGLLTAFLQHCRLD